MKIDVLRYNDNGRATLSIIRVDGLFECYGLEDERREVKIMGKTRIPNGTYTIKLRKEGKSHEKYAKLFKFHEGMIHVQDVPNFTWILIHKGNTDEDTAGCLLLGRLPASDGTIKDSATAYVKFYKKAVEAIRKEPVTITYSQIYYEDA